jgi:hypothetical protein
MKIALMKEELMLAIDTPTRRAGNSPILLAAPLTTIPASATGRAGGDDVGPLLRDLVERVRRAREAAAIDAEDILTQADEAGGFDPVG